MVRPSPSESATKFKVGTIKTGNDGNKWIIAENKNGVKRWAKYKGSQSKSSQNFELTFGKKGGETLLFVIKFPMNKKYKLKSFGKIKFSSYPIAGESVLTDKIKDFGKGEYYVYKAYDNLIISKKKLDTIVGKEWKHVYNFGVDWGTFGFWDYDTLVKLNKLEAEKQETRGKIKGGRKSRKRNLVYIPFITYTKAVYKKAFGVMFVKIKDLDNQKLYSDLDGEKIIGIMTKTGGDGEYAVWKYKNDALMLINSATMADIGKEWTKLEEKK